MVLMTRRIGLMTERLEEAEDDEIRNATDLPPEYCDYRDEGCDRAPSCLDCPFPRCLYEVPHDRRRWVTRTRNGGMARLRREGWKIGELAVLYGVSERTVQRALNAPVRKENRYDAD